MQRARTVMLFLATWIVLSIPALAVVGLTDKLALHAAINAHHSGWADAFFRFFTHGADGLVPTAVALSLLAVKDVRSFLMVGLGSGVSAIVVQLLKRQVFPGMDRPGMYREALGEMTWVEGLELNHHFSFPSGHATAAFSMCLALAVVSGRTRMAVPLALIAALLAFSRVYLSQHFTEDILAGAALGTAVSGLVYVLLYRSAFSKRPWLMLRPGHLPNQ